MTLLASSYPLLDTFFTILWVFGFMLWIWLAILVFSDIFRSKDLSGWGKAGWTVLVFAIPLLGVLLYLIVRGRKMGQHAQEQAVAADLRTQDYIRSVVAEKDPIADLSKLSSLHDAGALSDDEFARMKAKLLETSRS